MITRSLLRPAPSVYAFVLPHKRNQDIIWCREIYKGTVLSLSVVDGWHDDSFLPGNIEGRRAASYIAETYPKIYLDHSATNLTLRAQHTADTVHDGVLRLYPKHVGGVGVFVFRYTDHTDLVTIGTIHSYILRGKQWVNPPGIRDVFLDWKSYQSGSKTFFGRGEITDSFYSHTADALQIPPSVPILVATDGTDAVLPLSVINRIMQQFNTVEQGFVDSLLTYADTHKSEQTDDLSVLLSLPV